MRISLNIVRLHQQQKPNTMTRELRSIEQALLNAFASGITYDEVVRSVPEYAGRIESTLRSIFDRFVREERQEARQAVAGIQTPADIEEAVRRDRKIREEKIRLVKAQSWEEAARLRDREKAYSFLGQTEDDLSFEEALEALEVLLDAAAAEEQQLGPLTFIVDPGTATPEEIAELLAEISALYRMIGGSGITFTPSEVKEAEVA
jgi:hypothetical protein